MRSKSIDISKSQPGTSLKSKIIETFKAKFPGLKLETTHGSPVRVDIMRDINKLWHEAMKNKSKNKHNYKCQLGTIDLLLILILRKRVFIYCLGLNQNDYQNLIVKWKIAEDKSKQEFRQKAERIFCKILDYDLE